MKNGQCPKCNSTTIYSAPGGVYYGNGAAFCINIGSGWLPGTSFVSFLCTSCGYFENYVADPNKLAKVALDKNWQKVPVQAA